MLLKFKKLDRNAIIPVRGTPDSAGLDLSFVLPSVNDTLPVIDNNASDNIDELHYESVTIQIESISQKKYIDLPPHCTILLPTGLAVEPDNPEVALLIYPRSGTAVKKGLILANSVAVIDSDYRGEMKIPVRNTSNKSIRLFEFDRIAQLVTTPVLFPESVQVDELSDTERGSGGFGSTGLDTIENKKHNKTSKPVTIRDIIKNDTFDCNCNYNIYDCTNPSETWDTAENIWNTAANNNQDIPEEILDMLVSYITVDNHVLIIEAKKA